MSYGNPNEDILHNAYKEWHDTKGASAKTWMTILAEDIDFKSLANNAPGLEFTAQCCTRAEVGAYFTGLLADWTMLHYTIDDYICDGDKIAVIGRTAWTNKKNGKTLETDKVDVWRFEKDRAVAFSEYYDTAAAIAAAS